MVWEVSQASGNVSIWYKTCIDGTEGSWSSFFSFMMRYQNAINYAIFLLPNMLSYAFVANSWIDKLNTY